MSIQQQFMVVEQQSDTVDACRSCLMCRHVCTLGSITGWESDTPRGKGLALFKILKGHTTYSDDLVDTIYRCCLCGRCRTWCRGGYDMPEAILSARQDIVRQGMEPEVVASIRANIMDTGNPFGLPAADRFKAIDAEKVLTKKAEVLYYVGCDTAYYQPEIARAFLKVLSYAGVDYCLLGDETSSGKPLTVLGYVGEAHAVAKKLSERIRSTGCKVLVTTCPSSYDAFKKDYLGLLDGIEILHAAEYLRRLLDEGRFTLRNGPRRLVTLQDSDYLCRCHSLDSDLRRVLQGIPNLDLKEMTWSRRMALSSGEVGGVFHLLYPELSFQLASRVLREASRTGTHCLATACPVTKRTLISASQTDMEIRDVVEFFSESLREDEMGDATGIP